jgi:hypothetical protein
MASDRFRLLCRGRCGVRARSGRRFRNELRRALGESDRRDT